MPDLHLPLTHDIVRREWERISSHGARGNRIWHALIPVAETDSASWARTSEASSTDLVTRALRAPCVAGLSATRVHPGGDSRGEVIIAADAEGAVVLDGVPEGEVYEWSACSHRDIAEVLRRVIERVPFFDAPPQVTVRSGQGMRLTASQRAQFADRLAAGASPDVAALGVAGLSETQRNLMGASGDRASFLMCLDAPGAAPGDGPSMLLERRWFATESRLFSVDGADVLADAAFEVGPGDVLGTALALLGEGVEFATAVAR